MCLVGRQLPVRDQDVAWTNHGIRRLHRPFPPVLPIPSCQNEPAQKAKAKEGGRRKEGRNGRRGSASTEGHLTVWRECTAEARRGWQLPLSGAEGESVARSLGPDRSEGGELFCGLPGRPWRTGVLGLLEGTRACWKYWERVGVWECGSIVK